MIANIIFENVRVYDVQRFDVVVGQAFNIGLEAGAGEADGGVHWFANKDRVLQIEEDASGLTAQVTASATGTSEIQLQREDGHVWKTLRITVYNPAEATRLDITAGDPKLKDRQQ